MHSCRDLYRFASSNTYTAAVASAADVESCTKVNEQGSNGNGDGTKKKKWARRGLDIGTGVSAIYPLLLTTSLFDDPVVANDDDDDELLLEGGGQDNTTDCSTVNCCCRRPWTFLATDIDPVAIESARINIQANSLDDRIQVVQVVKDDDDADDSVRNDKSTMEPRGRGPLFASMSALRRERCCPVVDEAGEERPEEELSYYPKLDFVMTNPPFYSSLSEATEPRAGDKRARTDMSSNESVYQQRTTATTSSTSVENVTDVNEECHVAEQGGGDVGFITSIINDSQYFRHHVTWYTSLIAKRSSLDAILRKLNTLDGVWGNRGQILTVEFRQSNIIESSDNDDEIRERVDSSPRVRWGIAWTYERAIGRSSACRVKSGLQSFDVWISSTTGDADDNRAKSACDEVASRLITYFENARETSLKCSHQMREYGCDEKIQSEKQSAWCVTAVEERFCNLCPPRSPMTTNENDNKNLPIEGHFVIDAFVESSGSQNDHGEVCVTVVLECYSHTKYGSVVVDKIRNLMPGEIGRTNRRWRRLLKPPTM